MPCEDFSGMAEGGGLSIDNALHGATITVDEEGTEAATAAMVEIPIEEVEEVKMAIDRPFMFAIITRETGTILFLSQVRNSAVE